MFQIAAITALLLFASALGARAEEPARKQRAPINYSERVQIYEMPTTIAPPQRVQIPDGDRSSDSTPSAFPESVIRKPFPGLSMPTQPEANPEAYRPGSLRESITEGLRGSDFRTNTASGWGWLADSIATNRARTESSSRKDPFRSDDEDDLFSDRRADARTNQTDDARDNRPSRSEEENRNRDTGATRIEPILGWAGGDAPAAPTKSDLALPSVSMDAAIEASAASSALDWSAPPSYSAWSRSPSDAQRSDVVRDVADQLSVTRAAAIAPRAEADTARSIPTDARFGNAARFETVDASSLFSRPTATLDSGSSFSPFSVAPVDATALQIPAASSTLSPISSLGNSSIGSETPARSLGGFGTDRDRATPKTLPW